ncbi:PAS domain S-box protein, partial [Klebsiella pneumoniae]|nr:PAS domain S-box protein [Klebsiella pneumoniae]
VNQTLADIVGYPAPQLLEMTFQDITVPEDLETDLALAARVCKGEQSTYSLEKRYMHAEGHVVWVNLSVSAALDDQGRPTHF